MQTVELFCGTKSFSKVAKEKSHKTFTIDIEKKFLPDSVEDISKMDIEILPKPIDVLWASPPCTCFSVASISKHWTGGIRSYIPKTEEAKISIELIRRTAEIIKEIQPTHWFIENPRCVLRKIIDNIFLEEGVKDYKRHTVTYCQYGDTRMKPTDIWTNSEIQFKPPCKNGAPCHEAAPRGSRTGTQGLNSSTERGVIPKASMEDIFEYIESI